MITLDGENLGQKHQHYNILLKECTEKDTSREIKKIDYDEPDIDNLFNIDIACNKKNVDYILDVFKCDDMLYVSRALKQSLWLITDVRYADIINPDYLYSQLLPQMNSKAGSKLLLSIRLNLKEEKRVEQFHGYYDEKHELNAALKWLPNCSILYIENVVEKHASNIPVKLLKKLCEKSTKILEICARHSLDTYQENERIRTLLSKTTFLLNKDPKRYISVLNSQEEYTIPRFNSKYTQIIMKTKPDIILDNFKKFACRIDVPTFVKFLKREDIKDFFLKHYNELKTLFTFERLKYFIFRMPSESRFDFIKSTCIEQNNYISDDSIFYNKHSQADGIVLHSALDTTPLSSNADIYKWYIFAPFSTAFKDLKKLIRIESRPSERNEIFAVLITCARQNSTNLHTILQYYKDRHMNEPYRFKSHFVNMLLSQSMPHRLDDKCCNILNEMFYSMEVYSETQNNVQSYLEHIIIYNVVRDTNVPDIVQNQFEFNTLKSFQHKLNDNEKNKVFQYLYEFIITKIQNFTVTNESSLEILIDHIINVLNLLRDWNKNLLDYNTVLEKIREIVKINIDNDWKLDLSEIYNVNKSWRKHMFKESLFLYPDRETFINALKHDPKTLMMSKNCICSEHLSIKLLNKLRIYWPRTLAKTFEDTFRNQLNKAIAHSTLNHNISVRGLLMLLPQRQLIDIISKYSPNHTKINWAETDIVLLSIQKSFAKHMHLARPHPPVEIVLLYAKGDYLQFVLPSVQSILFNISSDRIVKYMSTLLNAPVSLQKHGLTIAFAKLKIDELLPTCLNIWKSTKNSSIRANIFKLIYESLCNRTNEKYVHEIWHVLDTFIDDLKSDENQIIYVTLSQAEKVPIAIKQAYCIKAYRYFKSMPTRSNCDKLIMSVIYSTLDIMEFIDEIFIAEVILDTINTNFPELNYSYNDVISACLLSTKCEATQTQRYEQIFVPLLKKYLAFLENAGKNEWQLKKNFNNILVNILNDFINITINKNMTMPIKLFKDIYIDLKKNLAIEDNYVLIMTWKLAVKYVEIMNKYRDDVVDFLSGHQSEKVSDDSKRMKMYINAMPEFAKVCMQLLKEEVTKYFPSIYKLFTKALNTIFNNFYINQSNQLLPTLKAIQEYADINEGHLLIIKLFPRYVLDDSERKEIANICKMFNSHESVEVRMHYRQFLQHLNLYGY